MKVLAFNGSPRKDGNTSALIQTVFEPLKEAGIETEEINVGSHSVHGCIACMKCYENKDCHCVIKNDSVNEWLDKMKKSDGIILGSPVYCAGISGQIKTFIDRTIMVGRANDDMFKRKIGASVVAVRRAGGTSTFNTLNSYFTIAEMIIVGSSYWNIGYGMSKQEVLKDAEGIQTMRNLGMNMAWLLKSLEYAKGIVKEPETKINISTNFIRD